MNRQGLLSLQTNITLIKLLIPVTLSFFIPQLKTGAQSGKLKNNNSRLLDDAFNLRWLKHK